MSNGATARVTFKGRNIVASCGGRTSSSNTSSEALPIFGIGRA